MNGESTADDPNAIRMPKTTSARIMGISQHIFRAQRKRSSSPKMPSREVKSLTRSRIVILGLVGLEPGVELSTMITVLLPDQKWSHREQVKSAIAKGVPGIGGGWVKRVCTDLK